MRIERLESGLPLLCHGRLALQLDDDDEVKIAHCKSGKAVKGYLMRQFVKKLTEKEREVLLVWFDDSKVKWQDLLQIDRKRE